MKLHFGMPVLADGAVPVGTLDRVLMDPTTREVTHVVVRSPDVSEDVLLPLSMVQGSAGNRLLLHLPGADLTNMPRYYEGRTSSPPAGRVDTAGVQEPAERRADVETALYVPEEAHELGPEICITTIDGSDGQLLGLLTEDYGNRMSGLCMTGLCQRDLLIPAQWAGTFHPGAIAINATCGQLAELGLPHESGQSAEATERDRAERWHYEHTPAE